MNKKAIVTGGTGFVGSNLCRQLLKKGWHVSIISKKEFGYDNIRDIFEEIDIYEYNNNISELINFFSKTEADVVFHLASLYITEHKSDDIDNLIDSNIKFGVHILEAMKFSKTKILVNTGTSWQHFNNEKYNPVCLYAATKESFEKLIEYFTEAEGVKAITLKLFDTYGETDKRPKLINLLNTFAKDMTELNMSPGEQYIDLVHVDDVVNAFIVAYDILINSQNIKHEKYGVGTGKKIQLKQLIKLYEELSGNKILVNWGGKPYRAREVMDLWNDYKPLPNWTNEITLEVGLQRIIENN